MGQLFSAGEFVLHSGGTSNFLIDCDALTDADLEALAERAANLLPAFGHIVGIPRGGLRFAQALEPWSIPFDMDSLPTLVVDDVWTTGRSMVAELDRISVTQPEREPIGVVIFARGPVPARVAALFQMTPAR